MAKKPGGKKSAPKRVKRPNTALMRVASDVVADAKLLASFLKVSMVEYVSDTLRPIIKKELEDQMRRRLAESEETESEGETN